MDNLVVRGVMGRFQIFFFFFFGFCFCFPPLA